MTFIPKKSAVKTTRASITCFQRLLWICNTLFHQLVAIAGVFILWTLCYTFENRLSRWHMILTTLAYLPIMAEAIVLFSDDNVWTHKIMRTTRYYIHGCLLFTSAVLATVGISFMIKTKTSNHFQSLHAKLGLASWIFVLASQVLGLCSAKAQNLSFIIRPVWFKFIHNCFGIVGYATGLCSLCYGLEKHSFSNSVSQESVTASYFLIGIIGVWSLIAAVRSLFNQFLTIFRYT